MTKDLSAYRLLTVPQDVFISVGTNTVVLSKAAISGLGNPSAVHIYATADAVAITPDEYGATLYTVNKIPCRVQSTKVAREILKIASVAPNKKAHKFYGEIDNGVLFVNLGKEN